MSERTGGARKAVKLPALAVSGSSWRLVAQPPRAAGSLIPTAAFSPIFPSLPFPDVFPVSLRAIPPPWYGSSRSGIGQFGTCLRFPAAYRSPQA